MGPKAPAKSKRQRHGMFLWVGSGIVGLLAFALTWGIQHGMIRFGNYALVYLQSVVGYDPGMTRHAYASARDPKVRHPVTVVEFGRSTYQWAQTTDFSAAPEVPFESGKPARFQVYQRWFHTRILRNLQRLGARVVVFDVVFGEADPALDPAFAKAIQDHGRVILAAANDTGQESGGAAIRSKGLEYPTGELMVAALGLGMADLPQDGATGKISRFQWGTIGIDYDTGEDTIIPSLGVAAAAAYAGENPKTVLADPEHSGATFLSHRIRAAMGKLPERQSYITYFGPADAPAGPDSVIRYEDLFDLQRSSVPLEKLREVVRDRVVIIGSAAATDQDIHRVPVVSQRAVLGATEDMPGVQVQAHITQTVLSGQYVEQAEERTLVLLLFCACLVVAVAGRVLNPRALTVIGLLLVWGLCWSSGQLLSSGRLWMEPVTASLGVMLATLGETTFMFIAEHRARMQVRRQLSRHVGPGVANKLADEDWPELGGESREVTMFFSDLQGFTSLSENMSPPEICQFLNRYCAVMIPILDKYEGALDKVMGDGFMVMFGWPARHPDHAQRAIHCSVEIQHALEAWAKLPENQGLPPLRTRIGLHTGVATVGEIGVTGRAEFTVIGDIVNVASRLEGMNKEFGTRILISDATREAAGEIVPMQHRGMATVRGRAEPMPVYSVDVDL